MNKTKLSPEQCLEISRCLSEHLGRLYSDKRDGHSEFTATSELLFRLRRESGRVAVWLSPEEIDLLNGTGCAMRVLGTPLEKIS